MIHWRTLRSLFSLPVCWGRLGCSGSDTWDWTPFSAEHTPCSLNPRPELVFQQCQLSADLQPQRVCTPDGKIVTSQKRNLRHFKNRIINGMFLTVCNLFRLSKGASVARSPGIPQPNRSVPAARYHDVDLWAVFHAANRGIVRANNRICVRIIGQDNMSKQTLNIFPKIYKPLWQKCAIPWSVFRSWVFNCASKPPLQECAGSCKCKR